ncbi:hypothetical protein [Micromonospora sp. WMMC273]|uniref:hypothetical protein n=1 Tax=Micromonospora sp. WMMC273 TaxID=3015157 RepID=UPI0022B6E033|nr:hypothetical protein [Micromonospora sp. WMMC273]MCZ7478858.1 hypothetical protein [Micromonospora sp. WMMC273]
MAAKAQTPNTAQTAALTEGAATGFLPADTPNAKRTAEACVRRGWATQDDEGRYPITDAGRMAIGVEPVDPPVDEVPADDVPVVDLRADEAEAPAEEVEEPKTLEDFRAEDEARVEIGTIVDEDETPAEQDAPAEQVEEPKTLEDFREEDLARVEIGTVVDEDEAPEGDVEGTEPVEAEAHPYDELADAEEPAQPVAEATEEPEAEVTEEPAAEAAAEPEAEAAAEEPQGFPVPEIIKVNIDKMEAGRLLVLTEGQRVHHRERIVGGCNGEGHRRGVLTGRHRITQGRDHVEVKLDCGHVKWPLQRVLVVEAMPGEWLEAYVATAGELTGDLAGVQTAIEFYAMGLTGGDAGAWVREGHSPAAARQAIRDGKTPAELVAA